MKNEELVRKVVDAIINHTEKTTEIRLKDTEEGLVVALYYGDNLSTTFAVRNNLETFPITTEEIVQSMHYLKVNQ